MTSATPPSSPRRKRCGIAVTMPLYGATAVRLGLPPLAGWTDLRSFLFSFRRAAYRYAPRHNAYCSPLSAHYLSTCVLTCSRFSLFCARLSVRTSVAAPRLEHHFRHAGLRNIIMRRHADRLWAALREQRASRLTCRALCSYVTGHLHTRISAASSQRLP